MALEVVAVISRVSKGISIMKNKGISITSSFNFNDKVKILPLEVEGRVTSFWAKEENYSMIEVIYFINN